MTTIRYSTADVHGQIHPGQTRLIDNTARALGSYLWTNHGQLTFHTALTIVALFPDPVPLYEHIYQLAMTALRDETLNPDPVHPHTNATRFTALMHEQLNAAGVGIQLPDITGPHGRPVLLNTRDLELNTSLIAGSAALALIARIAGAPDGQLIIEGIDRAWFASAIEDALAANLLTDADHPGNGRHGWRALADVARAETISPLLLTHPGHERGFGHPHDELYPDREPAPAHSAHPNSRAFSSAHASTVIQLRTNPRPYRLAAHTLRHHIGPAPVTVADVLARDHRRSLDDLRHSATRFLTTAVK